ncbi:uncharacterized protein LOC113311154 [Papaver somniferum]|uniref:uncharacterized protein LOC113311154 n=1 Tax=Papaver somniferum TaxID=3469 RepID=UPI000E6FC35A|nr:uncharacterized protein LOC113311154 [Papaver somniferum]
MSSEMAGRGDERNLILAFINALFPTDLLFTQIFRMKDRITMADLREYQEEYIALEEKQRDMESYPVAITSEKIGNASLLPRMAKIASTSQGSKEKLIVEYQQKQVSMSSRYQEMYEQEYKERKYSNHGGNNKVASYDNHGDGYGGNRRYYNQGANYRVCAEIRMPPLNTTVDKVWEVVILMKDIAPPPNLGKEPPSGKRSKELCAYHRFHVHTTSNCKKIQRIILRMIVQGKINHLLATPLPPPPPPQPTTGRQM